MKIIVGVKIRNEVMIGGGNFVRDNIWWGDMVGGFLCKVKKMMKDVPGLKGIVPWEGLNMSERDKKLRSFGCTLWEDVSDMIYEKKWMWEKKMRRKMILSQMFVVFLNLIQNILFFFSNFTICYPNWKTNIEEKSIIFLIFFETNLNEWNLVTR
jgi:hypothetical protein